MMKMLRFRLTAMLLFGLFYTHPSSDAQTPPPQGQPKAPAASATAAAEEQLSPEEKKKRKDWNESMLHKPVPKKGGFNAAFPRFEWRVAAWVGPPPQKLLCHLGGMTGDAPRAPPTLFCNHILSAPPPPPPPH